MSPCRRMTAAVMRALHKYVQLKTLWMKVD